MYSHKPSRYYCCLKHFVHSILLNNIIVIEFFLCAVKLFIIIYLQLYLPCIHKKINLINLRLKNSVSSFSLRFLTDCLSISNLI